MARIHKQRVDKKGRILNKGESQRQDGCYMFRYTDKNTLTDKYVYSWTLTKTDVTPAGKHAGLCLREIETSLAEDILIDKSLKTNKSTMTLHAMLDKYIELNDFKWRPTTKLGHKTAYKQIANSDFYERDIRTLNKLELRTWFVSLANKGLSRSSIRCIKGLINQTLTMAEDLGLLKNNPVATIIISDVCNDTTKEKEALSKADEKRYIKYCKVDDTYEWMADIVYILIHTGLRIGELCGLTLQDVDFEHHQLIIKKQLKYAQGIGLYVELPKTPAGERVVPMIDKVEQTFNKIIKERPALTKEPIVNNNNGLAFTNFVFICKCCRDTKHDLQFRESSYKPIAPSQVEKALQASIEKFNSYPIEPLPVFTPHALRHTFITRLVIADVRPKKVQLLVGHEDIATTLRIYTHIKSQQIKDDALMQMEDVLGDND